MCECGCTMNNEMYTLPGPGGAVYLINFQRACVDCDGPSAIMIDRFESKKKLRELVWEIPDALPLEKCGESNSCTVITGMLKHEFVKKLGHILEGTSLKGLADKKGVIDAIGAEVILEYLYDESIVTPHLPKPDKVKKKNSVAKEARGE